MEAKCVKTQKELDAAFHIRKIVFVEEQGVPLEDEYDEHDAHSEHILVYHEGRPVATGRLRIVDEAAKLERICVLATHRQSGVGKVVVKALESIAMEKGIVRTKLHGQTHAEGFYQKLGYRTVSGVFMEDGIPHVVMVKDLSRD